jgi:ketosteroid isomerase-like protein
MPETPKATLEKMNAAILKLDFDGALAFCTDDTAWTFEGDQVLKGKQAVRQWMLENYKEPPSFTLQRTVAEGDFLVALGEITVPDEHGRAVLHHYSDVWLLRDGLFAELHAFVMKAL